MDQKSQKYDRQLRLWGEHGQAALEGSHVCLLNGSAVGTEILKNLVLPGFGSFTVVDSNLVKGQDVGNNFFLEKSSIGLKRGKVVTDLLKEMNDDVAGNFVDADPYGLIESNSDIFSQFSFVIATELTEKICLKLGRICWERGIPLLIAKCYGLFGYLRVAVPEHTIVETHPDNPTDDLRLTNPLPELVSYVDSINLDQLDASERAHVPYLVLLLKALKTWKDEHNGEAPKNSAEKDQFREALMKLGGIGNQNSEEAVANAHRAWAQSSIPGSVQDIFADPCCKNLHSKSTDFWILARAVSDFVNSKEEGNGSLPLQGSIPDMHSDTKSFTKIQEIYQAKAKQDMSMIASRVNTLCTSLNRAPESISLDLVKRFCKNASRLTLIRYRSLDQENQTPKSSYLGSSLEDQENNLKIYVLLKAADNFYEKFKRYPGVHDGEVESDIPLLKKSTLEVLSSLGVSGNPIKDDYIHELSRFGASELHNIAAFLGGVGSQEVIKLITHQFVPMNNTFIFNGVHSTCLTDVL